jgi:hypothetical protein
MSKTGMSKTRMSKTRLSKTGMSKTKMSKLMTHGKNRWEKVSHEVKMENVRKKKNGNSMSVHTGENCNTTPLLLSKDSRLGVCDGSLIVNPSHLFEHSQGRHRDLMMVNEFSS